MSKASHIVRPTDALSDRLKAKFAAYVARRKAKGEAASKSTNVWSLPVYQSPAADAPARPGADDHRKFKSKGF